MPVGTIKMVLKRTLLYSLFRRLRGMMFRRFKRRMQREHKGSGIVGLVFSKDRALQLDATLRSLFAHCKDVHAMDIHVIYSASSTLHQECYAKLIQEHSGVSFISEGIFREDVLLLLQPYEHVLFLVDDNIFVRDFCLADVVTALQRNRECLGFSLRLGTNVTRNYHSQRQDLPRFTPVGDAVMAYEWTGATGSFAYPLEVSSSVYRVCDVLPVLIKQEFDNPSSLEIELNRHKAHYAGDRGSLLCYRRSVTFCAPVNVVQVAYKNRAGSRAEYSAESLARSFADGNRIRVEDYADMLPGACHQEVDLVFVQRGDKG